MRVLVASVLLALAVAAAVRHAAARIPARLEAEVRAAVAQLGEKRLGVEVDGLDVRLVGEVAEESLARQAESAARAVRGVRRVDARIVVAPGDSSGLAAPAPATAAIAGAGDVVSWDSCQQGLDAALSSGRVDFASDSAEIEAASLSLLDELVAVLEQCADSRIEIGGHTDASGPEADNLELSRWRAEAVRDYLRDRGVPAERLTAVGYGSARPVADNETAAGRARNRRIELRVLDR